MQAEASDKAAAALPADDVSGTLHNHSGDVANGRAGDKRTRQGDDASASPRPKRDSSHSPMRSPSRHKHSKKHKKEHSHKKSKRDKHGGADRTDERSEVSDGAAAASGAAAAGVSDDLEALRQAALQTTKVTAAQDTANADAG